MSVTINNNSGLIGSPESGCGCGNRKYYTKAEIDEMFDNIDVEDMATTGWVDSNYLKDITITINGTEVHNNGSIDVGGGGDISGKLDTTAFTQAMESETARTEDTYAKKSEIPSLQGYATQEWVGDQGFLKDITLTINGTELHNNGDIIIPGGGGEPVDISGKLDTTAFTQAMQSETARTENVYAKKTDLAEKVDTSAFTAYTASTETWENNMEDCCDEVKTYIDYLQYMIEDLQRQIDELKPEPGPEPTPTGDTLTLATVYNVTSTTEPTTIIKSGGKSVAKSFTYNGVKHTINNNSNIPVEFTFPATGEQTVYFELTSSQIGRYAFYKTPLKRVTIPSGVTNIDDFCFNTTKLTGVTIPDSVTHIGQEALAFNTSISQSGYFDIHIGSGLQTVESYINPKTLGTQNIYFASATPPTFTESGYIIYSKHSMRPNIYVPSSSVQAYKAAPGFSNVVDTIQGI